MFQIAKIVSSVQRESMTVSGMAHTLAILSLGNLTAAIIAVGNLLLSQTG